MRKVFDKSSNSRVTDVNLPDLRCEKDAWHLRRLVGVIKCPVLIQTLIRVGLEDCVEISDVLVVLVVGLVVGLVVEPGLVVGLVVEPGLGLSARGSGGQQGQRRPAGSAAASGVSGGQFGEPGGADLG